MNIDLKPRTRENVIIYFHKAQDEEIKRFLPQKAKSAAEALADYEKTLLPGAASYGRSIYTDCVYVGDIWAYCIGEEEPNAMLSFCIFDKSMWGRGIATKAVESFIAEMRKKYGLKTLGAFTFSDNHPSVRVLKENGFKEIETFTEDGRQSKYFQLEL